MNGTEREVESVDLAGGEATSGTFTYGTQWTDRPAIGVQVGSEDETADAGVDIGPHLEEYANDGGVVDTGGLRTAIVDWFVGDVDTDLLLEAIDAWNGGERVT